MGLERFGEKFYNLNFGNGAPIPVKGRKGNEPTFWEFISAILNVCFFYFSYQFLNSRCLAFYLNLF
jgi:hypothetical protein